MRIQAVTVRTHNRSTTLDSLRAIAALLVVWMHVSVSYAYFLGMQQAPSWVQAVAYQAQFGAFGVTLFFAISGYLIPSSIHGTRWTGLKKFAVRRFFRLYPVFWLSIPFGVITTWWLWGKSISAQDVALNFTMFAGALRAPQFIAPSEFFIWLGLIVFVVVRLANHSLFFV